jgi:hypothetical protein
LAVGEHHGIAWRVDAAGEEVDLPPRAEGRGDRSPRTTNTTPGDVHLRLNREVAQFGEIQSDNAACHRVCWYFL